MRCDVIAQGVINAANTLNLKIPVIVRLQGKYMISLQLMLFLIQGFIYLICVFKRDSFKFIFDTWLDWLVLYGLYNPIQFHQCRGISLPSIIPPRKMADDSYTLNEADAKAHGNLLNNLLKIKVGEENLATPIN